MLDNRTLIYTAVASDGSGPWLYATDVERKVPHRISLGLVHFVSVTASADGRRVAATIANPSAKIWTVPYGKYGTGSGGTSDCASRNSRRIARPGTGLLALRIVFGPCRWAVEIPKWRRERAVERRARSRSGGPGDLAGRQADLCSRAEEARGILHLMTADGTEARSIAETLDVRQTPSWSPNGKWVAVAAIQNGEASKVRASFEFPRTEANRSR